jgi:acetyltransferase-like isoleucine patch superfamily enzyme
MVGVEYGKNLAGNHCVIKNEGKIKLGDNVCLNSYPDGESYKTGLTTFLESSSIRIGNNCWLNGTTIYARSEVIIGDNCMLGHGTIILDNNFHNISIDPVKRRCSEIVSRPIVLGDNVWVGRQSIILKGVNIGDNSIIAAGSVVTKNVPPDQLFGGNPASFIKNLTK